MRGRRWPTWHASTSGTVCAPRNRGALSRAALLAGVTGAERRALAWVLRDVGDAPLSPERCRQAARELETMSLGDGTESVPREGMRGA